MDGPIASMRLKTLRDGMEDYEYFALLEKRADTDAVMRIVSEIAPEWWDFSTDPADYDTARRKLAEEIIRAK